jgi:hypothetical protein
MLLDRQQRSDALTFADLPALLHEDKAMSKQRYMSIKFNRATLELIETMIGVVGDYMRQGFTLTVRQLYYQLVARAIIPNTEQSYKRITNIVNDARIAGLMDWDAIEDRTRAFVRRQRWDSGEQILKAASDSFHMDMWELQAERVFVIIEKEALVGVLQDVCRKWDVPILAARGYPSGTVLREFAVSDMIPALRGSQRSIIVHLGDHDPSGLDMSRDLQERLSMFSGSVVELKRIALNMDQIEERKPPPNPAKVTDSRFESYAAQFGDESWELDALPPQYLVDLVEAEIQTHVQPAEWHEREDEVDQIKQRIVELAGEFQ